MEELDSNRRRRSGGPHTPEGKAASSRNSLQHGCRSKIVILPNEKPEDFEATRERWFAEFEPDDDASLHFVEQIILNDWFLQRTIKRYNAVEEKLSAFDFSIWTEEQHKEMQLSLRYKGEAERALNRAIRAADLWRKNRNQEARQIERDCRAAQKDLFLQQVRIAADKSQLQKQFDAIDRMLREAQEKHRIDVSEQRAALQLLNPDPENGGRAASSRKRSATAEPPKTAAQLLFAGSDPKKQKKIHTLEQWVEITVENGKTVTRLVPANDELIEHGKRMHPPPDLVYRRFNFVDGVPSEYRWATRDPEAWRLGGHGIQRMTPDTWLEMIEKEKNDPNGHVGPTPGINLPRPKERGGCDCPVCTTNQAILDRGAERDCEREHRPESNPDA